MPSLAPESPESPESNEATTLAPRAPRAWTGLRRVDFFQEATVSLSIPQLLSIQLFLTFFAPPLPLAGKKIFPGDLWLFIWIFWVGMTGLKDRLKARYFHPFMISCLVITLAYLHGFLRPDLSAMVPSISGKAIDQIFRPVEEFVVAFRFLSWIFAGLYVYDWARSTRWLDRHLSRIRVLLRIFLVVTAGVMTAERFAPGFHESLARVFGTMISDTTWMHRAFGFFQSPIEAGAVFGLGSLIATREEEGWSTFLAFQGLAVYGVWLTGTMSAILPNLLVIAIRAYFSIDKVKVRSVVLALVAFSSALVMSFVVNETLFYMKYGSAWSRTLLWKAYADQFFSKPSSLFFGFGFIPLYSDNSYLWLIARCGIVGAVVLTIGVINGIQERWKEWSWQQRSVLFYLAFSGLMLDVCIFRPIVILMITLGLPLLARRPVSES